MSIATGLAMGKEATPELAKLAVSRAMEKAGITTPSAVLLFLTSEFAKDPDPAIKAAAKAAACTQVIGCSAPGIFTEEDWVLDSPAAAAMVFSDTATLSVTEKEAASLLLTFAAPNAINSTWLNHPLHQSTPRFGSISGDATGQGAFSVWQNGKGAQQGYCEVAIQKATSAFKASHGLKVMSKPKRISSVKQHQLLLIDGIEAVTSLNAAWDKLSNQHHQPLRHQLVAIYAKEREAITEEDDYRVATILTSDDDDGAVTLSKALETGDWLSWALRDANTAQVDMVKTASKLRVSLMADPSFAMLFSCLGRGPSFYNGSDQDLELVKTLFPGLPIIGFYGNGEIAPITGRNEILDHSAVLGLFA
jgi:small ligand-binding sensory domain FIST